MKKFLAISAAVLLVGSISSCKKERDCKCTVTSNGTSIESVVTIKDTKKNAEEECESANGTIAGVTTKCELD